MSGPPVVRHFVRLGFGLYQARLMAALFEMGSGTCADLAGRAKVPSTGVYKVMKELRDLGFVEETPTVGPAVWTCRPIEDVIAAIDVRIQHKFDEHQAELALLRKALPRPSRSA